MEGTNDATPVTGRRPGPGEGLARRGARAAVLAGLAVATGVVAAVDPATHGVWPPCPSRLVLGLDCPACGGLRGTHDLLHGRLADALDHNLLLPLALPAAAVALALWLLPLVGRPARTLHPPRAAVVAGVVLVAVFTIARNLPVAGLEALGSG